MIAPMDYEQATIAVSRLGLDNDAVEREAKKLIESMEKKGTTIKDSRQIMMNLKTQYKDTANVAEFVFDILERRTDLVAKLLGIESGPTFETAFEKEFKLWRGTFLSFDGVMVKQNNPKKKGFPPNP